jgi:hypothetical protein
MAPAAVRFGPDSVIAEERETSAVTSDVDREVRIWSAQARYITNMRKHPVREIRVGRVDGTEFAEFTGPRGAVEASHRREARQRHEY